MLEIQLKIDGMMCGMCESHVNGTVRNAFPVDKVISSHRKGRTMITSQHLISKDQLQQALDPLGYRILEYQCIAKPESVRRV